MSAHPPPHGDLRAPAAPDSQLSPGSRSSSATAVHGPQPLVGYHVADFGWRQRRHLPPRCPRPHGLTAPSRSSGPVGSPQSAAAVRAPASRIPRSERRRGRHELQIYTSRHPFADHGEVAGRGGRWDGRGVSTPDIPAAPPACRAQRRGGSSGDGGVRPGRQRRPPAPPPRARRQRNPPAQPAWAPGSSHRRRREPRAPSRPYPTSPSAGVASSRTCAWSSPQPTAGEFRGFGIVCTHDGCELNAVANGTINCPCHGSRYAITDGSVVDGPARTGLRTYAVAVDGDKVVLL